MKPLLIGEAPGPKGDPERPLDGGPARRLLECMAFPGIVPEEAGDKLREMFDVRNLIERRMERPEGQKGTEWPAEEAKQNAGRLLLLMERGQKVVFCGKRAAAAFGVQTEWFRWFALADKPSVEFALIPHPSGIVRTWNDPTNRVRAGMVLWQAMGRIPQ